MLERSGYEALGALYDAAITMDRWTNAIDAVATAVEGVTGALLIREKGINPCHRDPAR